MKNRSGYEAGPRPEVPTYVDMYTADQRNVLDLEPGITDRASILFADESDLLAEHEDPERFYIEKVVPEKIRINLEYAERATPLSDPGDDWTRSTAATQSTVGNREGSGNAVASSYLP